MGRGHIPFLSLRKGYMLKSRKVRDPYLLLGIDVPVVLQEELPAWLYSKDIVSYPGC